jgi:hypothetical protein
MGKEFAKGLLRSEYLNADNISPDEHCKQKPLQQKAKGVRKAQAREGKCRPEYGMTFLKFIKLYYAEVSLCFM